MAEINLDVSMAKDTQQIKIDLLEMVNEGKNPFDIILHFGKWLEQASAEPGFAKYFTDQIRAVYGYALQDKKNLADEYEEIKNRLSIMESRKDNPDFPAEVKERIGFAIEAHKKQLEKLEPLLEC